MGQATIDNSQAAKTIPWKLRDAEPGRCAFGEVYQNTITGTVRLCATLNTWSDLGGSVSLPGTVMQTNQSNTISAGTQDASGAAHTLPAKRGLISALPATCTVGEEYFATDATAGQNKYFCTATNTWTQQLNGGGGATYTKDLLDGKVTRSTATQLLTGTCSGGGACQFSVGSTPYAWSGGCTVTSDNVGSSNGHVSVYVKSGTSTPSVGWTAGTPGVTTACGNDGAIAQLPANALTLAEWDIVAGQFPTFVTANDTRPFFQSNTSLTGPQIYERWFGKSDTTNAGTASGSGYRTNSDFTALLNIVEDGGIALFMNHTSGTYVVSWFHLMDGQTGGGGWTGTPIYLSFRWMNTAGGAGAVRWDVSVRCGKNSALAGNTFGTPSSTLVTVAAGSTWVDSIVSVPLLGVSGVACAPGDTMALKIANSPTSTGTTYTSDIYLANMAAYIIQ